MEGDKFYRGVFWVIDGALLAHPFIEGVYAEGTARSGVTYNHKKLWEQLHGSRGKPYNYYPRGRVDADNRGQPAIYMSPYVPVSLLLCRVYERTNSIWGSIFFHMLVNYIAMNALKALEALL